MTLTASVPVRQGRSVSLAALKEGFDPFLLLVSAQPEGVLECPLALSDGGKYIRHGLGGLVALEKVDSLERKRKKRRLYSSNLQSQPMTNAG